MNACCTYWKSVAILLRLVCFEQHKSMHIEETWSNCLLLLFRSWFYSIFNLFYHRKLYDLIWLITFTASYMRFAMPVSRQIIMQNPRWKVTRFHLIVISINGWEKDRTHHTHCIWKLTRNFPDRDHNTRILLLRNGK